MYLKVGSKGDLVRKLQSTLTESGFNPGPIDGIFGKKTRKAVIAFQESKELEADGIVGPITMEALGIEAELLASEGKMTISISARLAKADEQIQVTLVGSPGGHARFSIANIYNAIDVPMIENPDKPGTYLGTYTVEVGDNIENAAVTVVLTTQSGKTICRKARQKVTIDTIPPEIVRTEVSPEVVSNGEALQLQAVCDPNCQVVADISEVDTIQATVSLEENPDEPGLYQVEIAVSEENNATNGPKNIKFVATDAAGNESESALVSIELRNSELHVVHELSGEVAGKLNNVGVVTLADLRRIDVDKVTQETDLSAEELSRYQAAARFQAVGIDADVAYALVHLGDLRHLSQLALTPQEKIQEILRTAVHEGLIPEERTTDVNLASQVVSAGVGAATQLLNAYWVETRHGVNTCRTECADELSAFGCHAYLLELVKITGLSWDGLHNKFKQDFLAVTTAPARRITIAIEVLERAISEDLGNPPRLPYHWDEYDRALNQALVRILVESIGKSETVLTTDYPNVFDSNRPLVDRNGDLKKLLRELLSNDDYYKSLIKLLMKRTGKSKAELKAEYPKAFPPATLQERNETLEKILELPQSAAKVEEAKATLASLKLQALVK